MKDEIRLLHQGHYSCVVSNENEIRTFTQKGVTDLYDLVIHEPRFLKKAFVADKVVGKAAATLMCIGDIEEVYADIISDPALSVLTGAGIRISYGLQVPHIINRTRDGWCPLEKLCRDIEHPQQILAVIETFIKKIKHQSNFISI